MWNKQALIFHLIKLTQFSSSPWNCYFSRSQHQPINKPIMFGLFRINQFQIIFDFENCYYLCCRHVMLNNSKFCWKYGKWWVPFTYFSTRNFNKYSGILSSVNILLFFEHWIEIIYFLDKDVGDKSLKVSNGLERTMYMLLKNDKQINPEYLNHLLRLLTDDSCPSK